MNPFTDDSPSVNKMALIKGALVASSVRKRGVEERDEFWTDAVQVAAAKHFCPSVPLFDLDLWVSEWEMRPHLSEDPLEDLLEETELRFADLLALALKANTDFYDREPGWDVLNELCITRCHIELVFQLLTKAGTDFKGLKELRAFVDRRIGLFVACIDGEFHQCPRGKLLWKALADNPPVDHMDHKDSRWYIDQPMGWGVLTEEDKKFREEALKSLGRWCKHHPWPPDVGNEGAAE